MDNPTKGVRSLKLVIGLLYILSGVIKIMHNSSCQLDKKSTIF